MTFWGIIHFGTSEERAFTDFMLKVSNELKHKYKKVKLLRNEKAFKIHSFDEKLDGATFEPDFLLLLQNEKCYFQVFCEPKGKHLFDFDKWKNDFLEDITKCTNENKISSKKLSEGNDFKISLVLEILEIIEKKLLANKTNFVGSHKFHPVRNAIS